MDFDYDPTIHQNQALSDAQIVPRFFTQPVKNELKSEQEGRPIFDDVEMVELRVRGDRNNIPVTIVHDGHRQRFRDHYLRFKDNLKTPESGTPLSEWPIMSKAMVEEMKYLDFHTVEQLADASEMVLSKVPGLLTMKNKAKAFLDLSKGAAPLERLSNELAAEKAKNDALAEQMKDLASRLDELTAKKSK